MRRSPGNDVDTSAMGGTRSLKVEGTQRWAVVRVGIGLFPQLLKFFPEQGFALLFFLYSLLKAGAFLLFLFLQILQGFFERGSASFHPMFGDIQNAEGCTIDHQRCLTTRTSDFGWLIMGGH